MTDEQLIGLALEAAAAADPRDVPIGAVVVAADGTELARAANAREELGDPTAHAEILALRAAARVAGDGWRLEGALEKTGLPDHGARAGQGLLLMPWALFGPWSHGQTAQS